MTFSKVFFTVFLFLGFILTQSILPLEIDAESLQTTTEQSSERRYEFFYSKGMPSPPIDTSELTLVYHVPVRIHTGESKLSEPEILLIVEEINDIWWSQAGICFDVEVVDYDQTEEYGLDLWFHENIRGWNGYFVDEHEIRVKDNPHLYPADFSAQQSVARTASHELGHALGLPHRQDSDNNLMRSMTLGWLLNWNEVQIARQNAEILSLDEDVLPFCLAPVIR